MEPPEREYAFDTIAVHAGAEPDPLTGALAPPIYQTSTYAQDGVGRPRDGYEYARRQEPHARAPRTSGGGAGGRPPRHRVRLGFGRDGRARGAGGPRRRDDRWRRRVWRHVPLSRTRPPPKGIGTRYVDLTAGPDALHEALNERTRVVWFETPTNPLLKIVDIAAVAGVVHDAFPERRAPADRRRQHVRHAGAAAPARAGRGHRVPLVDEVPRRPLGHDPRRRGHPRRRASPSGCASSRTRWAACPDRSTASSSCAACGRSTSASSGTPRTPRRSRRFLARPRRRRAGVLPRPETAARHPGGAVGEGARCAAVAGWSRSSTAASGARERRAIAIVEGVPLFTLAESLGAVESLIEMPAVDDPRFGRRGRHSRSTRGARPPVGRDRGRRRSRGRPRSPRRGLSRPRRDACVRDQTTQPRRDSTCSPRSRWDRPRSVRRLPHSDG